jgi:HPt (histidine-containing phosphotransfer) domain-containing protein
MKGQEGRASPGVIPAAEAVQVFDRPHLVRYTMDNPELEREIIGLFMQQLPSIVEMLRSAASQADWKLAAHTLKGSAAAVGATAIHASAVALEAERFDADVTIRSNLLAELDLRIARFHRMIEQVYGPH